MGTKKREDRYLQKKFLLFAIILIAVIVYMMAPMLFVSILDYYRNEQVFR